MINDIPQAAALLALEIANDDSHGYDQRNRFGPDFDCSYLVIYIYSTLGIPLSCSYTGDMYEDFLKNGFNDVTSRVNLKTGAGLKPGDVLLCASHTVIAVSQYQVIAARINEKGTTTGGQTGDQTGTEICAQSYYNYPWQYVLRYSGESKPETIKNFPWVERGSFGVAVYAVQAALYARHYLVYLSDIDGICGSVTEAAIRKFQTDRRLEVDGIAGDETLTILFN